MGWIIGWLPLGSAAFVLVLINIFLATAGRHRGWQCLLLASLSCGGAALACALLEVNRYVQQKQWDAMTDVVPALAQLSAWALLLGIALNLIALWLHLRMEKQQNGA